MHYFTRYLKKKVITFYSFSLSRGWKCYFWRVCMCVWSRSPSMLKEVHTIEQSNNKKKQRTK